MNGFNFDGYPSSHINGPSDDCPSDAEIRSFMHQMERSKQIKLGEDRIKRLEEKLAEKEKIIAELQEWIFAAGTAFGQMMDITKKIGAERDEV